MNIVLKVKPEVLESKASEVEHYIKSLESEFDGIQDVVSKTTGYWTGIAGDKARSEFNSQKEDTQRIIRRFKEHPPELLSMAGIYKETESGNVQENKALEIDVII